MCYDICQEVIRMDEQDIITEEKQNSQPRPKWQVWCARIGVVIMIVSFLLYCWQIAAGGR